jgi:hypothetical protein
MHPKVQQLMYQQTIEREKDRKKGIKTRRQIFEEPL